MTAAATALRKSDPTICRACSGQLGDGHVRINGRAVCVACHEKLAGSAVQGVLAGLLAAGASVGLYYGVLELLGVRFLLIGVLAGVAIGAAVRRGRGYRVTGPYRLFAVGLTYLAVVSTYAHAVLEMPSVASPWSAWVATWLLPVRMALEGKNIVTLILLGLGLVEAWRFSAPPVAHVEGPFHADGSAMPATSDTPDTH